MVSERLAPEFRPKSKIFDLENLPFKPNEVTLVTGYFDIFHAGHLGFLEDCKSLGNPLVVGVATSAISTKPGRPINSDEDRMVVIAGLSCVDHVFLDEDGYSEHQIRTLQPKTIVFSTGENPSPEKQREIQFIKTLFPDLGITFIPRHRFDISTTQIIEKVLDTSPTSLTYPHQTEGEIIRGEIIRDEEIEVELLNYSKESNADIKTAAFVFLGNQVISRGRNYHPNFLGEVIFVNPNTHEYQQQRPRPTHAEMDAIIKLVQREVTDFSGLTMHTLHLPCAGCAEVIGSLGFNKVVCYTGFDNNYGELILNQHGVPLEKKWRE